MVNSSAFITAAGKFLPGKPVTNDEIEEYLGLIHNEPSRTKERILRQNGINSRYYAINKQQEAQYSLSEMVAFAIDDCLKRSGVSKDKIGFLAAATTQGDLPVPGFASMVHAASDLKQCEIATLHGVCGSGMMALKSAWLNIATKQHQNAVSCAGEFASRMFKKQRFENQKVAGSNGSIPLEVDFLRWMLSDGGGALLVQPEPYANTSLKIKWIDIQSYAHLFDVCMYAGLNKNKQHFSNFWLDYPSFSAADEEGVINLKQDIKIVDNIVKLGVKRFFELIDEGRIDPKNIDHFLCHYSSHYFKKPILDLLKKGGTSIPEDKWFTNLYTKGNTGSASIYIMLDELLNEKELQNGEQILCMVPESGRFLTSFMMLEVHKKNDERPTYFTPIQAPEIQVMGGEVQERLVRELTKVWFDFETGLNKVPIVDRINRGILSLEDYRLLLLNLRQQVIDGSQWIARAASNVSMKYFDVRSAFIAHSSDEHRDYQILEKNYINLGGTMEELKHGEKNIGSEALSAYMFHRASQPDPFDLLGGMFIIEGLGNRLAGKWGRAIKEQLKLKSNQVSFLIYHESSDSNENHFERFENAVNSELLTEEVAERIIKTAKTVAKLYTLQLTELGNY
ncbi:beta-ketoacyl-ACP synthase III [Fulvivirgaceae bacterium BMA10]|uniref:Beta-ketoacyl-ACP synthase III n=1 Tax=Splendidivirga corallicola TaxID=3051826 RepID=A0ABT8KSU2_9BACT|nr:beta-ketoacyl-ACP synthase III [Fulvivirgaceae bacterium BMA10]